MQMSRKWVRLCLLATFWVHVSPGNLLSQGDVQLDKGRLIEVEDLSESLANALLNFSVAVRGGDLRTIRAFLADEVEALTFRHSTVGVGSSIKWISQSSVDLSHLQPVFTQRESLIEEWTAFLTGFSEIEDVRFKVTDSTFLKKTAGNFADSKIKFFLVGRDEAGNRSWVKGSGRLHAQQEEGGWEISLLVFDHIDFLKAEVDLFSEISLAAGLSVSLPSYGAPGNDAFVYHGAAAGDINGDGFIDLVATGISNNFVYLNQGNGTFKDVAWEIGFPATPHDVMAPLLVDYDNDGDLDLFLSAVGTQMLFKNELMEREEVSFVDVSLETGVAVPAVGFSATAGDVNGDGWPDLYVTSYNRYGRLMPNSWHQATNGTANLLFINQKDGTFKERAKTWGVNDGRWSYAAQFVDLNGDGRQDLYVVNDFGENALYMNLGTRFEDRAKSTGTLDPGNGMGVSFGDYNNDGQLDLYVTNMSSTAGNRILGRLFPESGPNNNVLRKLAAGNSLFRGESDGTFTEVTQQMGPFPAGWAWGGVFIDFDNDGWEDLYSPNGFISGESMKDT